MTEQEVFIKIKEQRKALGLSQEQVARASQLSYKSVLNLEKGQGVTFSTLMKVCKVLNLELNLKEK